MKRDRPITNVSEQGRKGRYVHNLLFIHEQAHEERVARLAQHGLALPP